MILIREPNTLHPPRSLNVDELDVEVMEELREKLVKLDLISHVSYYDDLMEYCVISYESNVPSDTHPRPVATECQIVCVKISHFVFIAEPAGGIKFVRVIPCET